MGKTNPSRYWVIKHPTNDDEEVVAKFDTSGKTIIPHKVANHDDFDIEKVFDRSSLLDKDIDQSGLTESEKEMLSKVYPITSE